MDADFLSYTIVEHPPLEHANGDGSSARNGPQNRSPKNPAGTACRLDEPRPCDTCRLRLYCKQTGSECETFKVWCNKGKISPHATRHPKPIKLG